ncbi:nitroreductase family protein [Sphaerochaeta globosa]|uniref:Nitroreductase n=1 Tax=Sphaerochaeta globosa (strain ATCC BAA-1886 / DSM 22777 / Buddy) TaxID=158189 RepID=F0RYI7_SPHGB|nr:nitroreductase family protein [Sphaerochaeta globosa]ADY12758.1 nitroreductase [Sphaerochaeta globosa str. Buddy]
MDFLEAMQHRFACKQYDRQRMLEELEIHTILEYGRLTPTSFGLELWSFHVVKSFQKKEALFHACFDQESVRTSAVTVAVLVRTAAFANPDGDLVHTRGKRFPDPLPVFIDDYRPYYEFLKSEGRLDCWLRSQGYLAIANMMTGSAAMGIQSCAIEGFDEKKVLRVLDANADQWQVSLLATFGYPAEQERPKIRESLDELVVYH